MTKQSTFGSSELFCLIAVCLCELFWLCQPETRGGGGRAAALYLGTTLEKACLRSLFRSSTMPTWWLRATDNCPLFRAVYSRMVCGLSGSKDTPGASTSSAVVRLLPSHTTWSILRDEHLKPFLLPPDSGKDPDTVSLV